MDTNYLLGLEQTVANALGEDGAGLDVTAQLIAADQSATADVITRETAVICGRPWVDEVFRQVDETVSVEWFVAEGEQVSPDTRLFRASGPARSILTAERTALNFLQTISGTATRTAHYAALVAHKPTRLLDTRKTLPGMRRAQKYAVKQGGGDNHRMGLSDAFLIKENHIVAAGSISLAIARARALFADRRVEIEVENLAQFREAAAAKPDWIMLDNFSIDDMRLAVGERTGELRLEASGGIETDDDFMRIAETGVDYISVGALTKHCRAIDLSMRFVAEPN
ncbi:MAG: carboxylating nicotinate-nucleotide diphosphorylase [Pseudomonadota bacterium]